MTPIGMLRYRRTDDLIYGVEASMISHVEPLSPLGKGGAISVIHLKNGESRTSLDGSDQLMDAYDRLVLAIRLPAIVPAIDEPFREC